jgi:hypothetical protein
MSESEHVQPTPTPAPSEHIQGTAGHGHAEHGSPDLPHPFSEDDLEQFHKDDRTAAGVVVGLMAGIFGIGLVLYTIVWYCVATGV